ncbi:hypothetical protein FRC07_004445 [Ceratobasidium sp. 392]|nr:hypothetical protein FRC07_004445 [Ceratobasidium sp. 392]
MLSSRLFTTYDEPYALQDITAQPVVYPEEPCPQPTNGGLESIMNLAMDQFLAFESFIRMVAAMLPVKVEVIESKYWSPAPSLISESSVFEDSQLCNALLCLRLQWDDDYLFGASIRITLEDMDLADVHLSDLLIMEHLQPISLADIDLREFNIMKSFAHAPLDPNLGELIKSAFAPEPNETVSGSPI